MQLASPSTSPTCWYSGSACSYRARGAVVVGAGQGDVAQALDAVGLAEHVAGLLIQRQRLLVLGPRAVVVGAVQRDVAQALDAVGLAEHVPGLLEQRQRLLVPGPGAVMVGPAIGEVAEG